MGWKISITVAIETKLVTESYYFPTNVGILTVANLRQDNLTSNGTIIRGTATFGSYNGTTKQWEKDPTVLTEVQALSLAGSLDVSSADKLPIPNTTRVICTASGAGRTFSRYLVNSIPEANHTNGAHAGALIVGAATDFFDGLIGLGMTDQRGRSYDSVTIDSRVSNRQRGHG